ncbi:MAG: hypothetical protein AAB916_01695 [Patescibacteria group bacterium]
MIEERRTGQDYAEVGEERERLQSIFSTDYLQPSYSDIESCRKKTERYLKDRNVAMVIPVKENSPVCTFLDHLVSDLPPECITVVDGGSASCALDTARRHGTRILSACAILDTIDWDRLLPILALDKKPCGPAGARGKGVAVFAGYLFQYALATHQQVFPRWICQHDSELARYEEYRGLEYLLYGLFQRPLASYIKMAQVGRENERCMAARSAFGDWATLPYLTPAIQKHASRVFEKLTRDQHMLAGEFMVSWDVAMRRPFGTGFLEETLIALFADPAVCVYNPNPRSDEKNPQHKESRMQQEIISFMNAVVLGEQCVDAWSIHDIARFNADVLSRPLPMGWIPDPTEQNPGPVRAEVFEQNRIMPSIRMLVDGGFIDEKMLTRLIP